MLIILLIYLALISILGPMVFNIVLSQHWGFNPYQGFYCLCGYNDPPRRSLHAFYSFHAFKWRHHTTHCLVWLIRVHGKFNMYWSIDYCKTLTSGEPLPPYDLEAFYKRLSDKSSTP